MQTKKSSRRREGVKMQTKMYTCVCTNKFGMTVDVRLRMIEAGTLSLIYK